MKKVCLDPGHGGTDKSNGYKGYREHEFTLALGLRIRELLPAGIDVVMTRETDKTVSLQERCDIANTAGADLFVSLHTNAGGAPNRGSGYGVYIPTGSDAQEKICELLIKELGGIGLWPHGSARKLAGFYVTLRTNMPACLVEYLFHDNDRDLAYLQDPLWRERMARATVAAICGYFGVAFVPPAAEPDEPEVPGVFYRVQVGAFNSRANAEAYKDRLIEAGFDGAFIVSAQKGRA